MFEKFHRKFFSEGWGFCVGSLFFVVSMRNDGVRGLRYLNNK